MSRQALVGFAVCTSGDWRISGIGRSSPLRRHAWGVEIANQRTETDWLVSFGLSVLSGPALAWSTLRCHLATFALFRFALWNPVNALISWKDTRIGIGNLHHSRGTQVEFQVNHIAFVSSSWLGIHIWIFRWRWSFVRYGFRMKCFELFLLVEAEIDFVWLLNQATWLVRVGLRELAKAAVIIRTPFILRSISKRIALKSHLHFAVYVKYFFLTGRPLSRLFKSPKEFLVLKWSLWQCYAGVIVDDGAVRLSSLGLKRFPLHEAFWKLRRYFVERLVYFGRNIDWDGRLGCNSPAWLVCLVLRLFELDSKWIIVFCLDKDWGFRLRFIYFDNWWAYASVSSPTEIFLRPLKKWKFLPLLWCLRTLFCET